MYIMLLPEVTISFNPTTYMVEEGQSVSFIVELTGDASMSVPFLFQTSDVSAIGKL